MDETDLLGELERLHPASLGWALWCCDHRRDEAEEVCDPTKKYVAINADYST